MDKPTIPFWTYLPEYKKDKKQLLKIVDQVFSSGQLILGKQVEEFEKEFAQFCGVKYAVGVGSGTDALFLALKARNIGEGDEVITVANTAIPTISAICATGARPVFVDIDPKTLLMDHAQIRSKLTTNTKCILPVHLYGQCADMTSINKIAKQKGIFVLEDCAQAHGAKWQEQRAGSLSDIAAFSFYPTKILGSFGDGGMIVTNNKELSDRLKALRVYGIKGKTYYSYFTGYNSRLDEIQAALLRFKLKRVLSTIKTHQQIAKRYLEGLKKSSFILPPYSNQNAEHIYHQFVLRHPQRDQIIKKAGDLGIQLGIHYPNPIHLMAGYKFLGYKKGDLPITEKACQEVFSLPIYPSLSEKSQDKIISYLNAY